MKAVILGLFLVFCISCAPDLATVPASFEEVMAAARARREAIVKPALDDLLPFTQGRTPVFDRQAIERFLVQRPPADYLSIEDAVADVEDLFNLLRDTYGGYVYFGGDGRYEPVKQAIIDEIRRNETVIAYGTFERAVAYNLSMIVHDRHFTIGRFAAATTAVWYYSTGAGFTKDENGFRNKENGKFVQSLTGNDDIEDVFRLHITEDGLFEWRPVVLRRKQSQASATTSLTLVYKDGFRETITLLRHTGRSYTQEFATLNRDRGFPVARVTNMGFSASVSASGAVARQFLGYAEELRDEPVVIVDLRGNPGGSGILPMEWLHILTGEVITPNFLSLDTSAIALPIIDDEGNIWNASTREANRLYWPAEVITGGYVAGLLCQRRITEREPLLILLVDRHSASAAEVFADLTLNIHNTLIVGTATAGVLTFNGGANLSLPRSGLPFSFGTALLHHSPGHLDEGVGLEPDIWVAGDALTAVAAMLKNAGFEGTP